jgi:tripartite-type tricarboxylate transporter receptor subunit TctC
MKTRSSFQIVKAFFWMLILMTVPPVPSFGQEYPTRPVEMIVGYAPGGAGDVVARLIAEKLTVSLGKQVIVDNRPGASGAIAARMVARAEPDGQTLLVGQTAEIAVNQHLMPSLGYDAATDLQPIALAGIIPLGLVVQAASPYPSMNALLEAARSNADGLTFASAGNGTPGHLAGELLRVRTRGNLTHVPYKGGGPALTDVLGGHVDFFFSGLPGAMPHVSAGNLKVLAVSTAKRSSSNPDIPTVAESGVADFDLGLWVGFFAPKATSREIVELLNGKINEILMAPEMQQRLKEQGLEVASMSVDETAAFVTAEIAKYGDIVKATGVKGE